MFWDIRNLILWTDAGKKLLRFPDDYKNGAFIIGQSEQQFKIQSHFGIFYPLFGEKKWYDDAASHALKCICGSFGNIFFLYSINHYRVFL